MAGSSSSRSSVVIQWGDKLAGSLSSYESMCFNGVRYDLYDCVFVRSGLVDPHIGKIMRMFQDELGVKKVRLRWFFRLHELPVFARKDIRQGKDVKEVFIAQGSMKGVENENLVEVILGKAVVLCTAKCRNNPVPSEAHVNGADHVFNRVYDVSNKKLGKLDKIDRSLAEKFFNKPEWLRTVQDVPRDGWRSPTSVTDFDMFEKPPMLKTPSLKSTKYHADRPSVEPLTHHVKKSSLEPLTNHVKRFSLVPIPHHVKRPPLEPLTHHVERYSLDPLPYHVKTPSMGPLPHHVKRTSMKPHTQHVKRTSLESATNDVKRRKKRELGDDYES